MGKPQKHKRNQISFWTILGPCPTLGTVASSNFLEYQANFYGETTGSPQCWTDTLSG